MELCAFTGKVLTFRIRSFPIILTNHVEQNVIDLSIEKLIGDVGNSCLGHKFGFCSMRKELKA